MSTSHDRPPTDWLESIQRNRLQVAYVLFGIALAFAVGGLVLVLKYRLDYVFPVFLCVLTTLLAVLTGVWQMTRQEEPSTESSLTRVLVLGIGGYFGLQIAGFGFYLMILWRATLLGGTEMWQGEQAWQVWVSLGVFITGLAVMFISLLVGRSEERSNATLRRVIYAYNAVLGALIVFMLLVVVNILGYLYLPVVSDWTASGLYTLSSKSRNILQGLEKPVKITVLQADRRVSGDLRNLLDIAQGLTNKLEVEYLSVHMQLDRVEEVVRKYVLTEREGVLIVYGSEPGSPHQFIREEDLIERRPAGRGRGQEHTFKGEDLVMTAIDALSQEKSKAVIYLTQGNGELDLNDQERTRLDRGLEVLRERLEKKNFQVKGLQLVAVDVGKKDDPRSVVSTTVPDDAAVVIIPGPRTPLPPEALVALTSYMKPADPKKAPGKLIVLLDVVVRDGQMVQTGLENWLADYNVEVGNNRLLTVQLQRRTQTVVAANPRLRGNPIASAFEGEPIPMFEVRSVRPRTARDPRPGASIFQAEELLVSVLQGAWAEENLRAEPTQLVADLIKNRREELQGKFQNLIPVAVAVSEPGGMPDIPEHRGMPTGTDTKPRLVVIGDATLASNALASEGSGTRSFDLLLSIIEWLRGRPQSIGIEAKKRDTYTMNQLNETEINRLVWLPLVLMTSGVFGLGLGVWVVRRK